MTTQEINKKFYNFAYDFLVKSTPAEITESVIKSYLSVPNPEKNCKSLNDIFYRMLFSAQNRQMSVNVIGGKIGGVENLGKVINNFDAKYVVEKYVNNENVLLNDIINEFNLAGEIRTESKSLWPQYCKTIVSVAVFLSQFKDIQDFYEWVNTFYNDKKSMAVLPLLISTELFGFQFALTCDFLKELGFTNYGKPDVHIKDILEAYGFISEKASDYAILKTMINISNDANVSCYEFDKVLWLIGSGRFYNNPEFGNNGFIGKMKDDFITLAPQFKKEMLD